MEGLKTRRFLFTFCFSFCIFFEVLPLLLSYGFFSSTFQCINPAVMLYLKVPCKCFRCFTQVLCLGYHQSSGYENSAAVMAVFIIAPPLPINMEGWGVYWNHFIYHPVRVSDCVHTIPPEPLSHCFYQTWCGGVLS